MYYIKGTSNEYGYYGNPMTQPFAGCVSLPDDLCHVYMNANGFVNIAVQDGIVTSVEKNEAAWEAWKSAQPPADLDVEKARRIQQSNDDLKDYLLAHPLEWNGEYYAITQEKQNQLTSKINVAQAKAQLGVPYELKWNTTGEVCVEWELADLLALAFAIDERVSKLVEYQQRQEKKIKNAQTMEELNAIEMDYDTVQ